MSRYKSFINTVLFKILLIIISVIVSLFIFIDPAFACSGVYVGSEVSQDGTILIARSNDTSPINKPFIYKVYGGSDGIQIKEISSPCGFKWALPDRIYRTICTPSSPSTDTYSSKAAINECGVSVSATVTGYVSKTALEANPYIKDGIDEMSIPLLVGTSCSTAREGIELLARIIDERGSCEDNILMISDQNEAWYMEIYSGHQYCAVKAPNDCVAVIGNEFIIETVDKDSPDVVCSKTLFSMPQEKGFAIYNQDGKMNIFDTYVGVNHYIDFSHMRTWRGRQILAPSKAGDYNATTRYPLFYKPDGKVSINQVMDIYRDRYQGTQYDIDKVGNNIYRPICTEQSQSTQILQTFKDVPADMCCVDWCAFSSAEFNIFVPCSNKQSDFDNAYTYTNDDFYDVDENCAFDVFKRLNVICAQNRKLLKPGVTQYWKNVENYMTGIMSNFLHSNTNNNSQNAINDFFRSLQNQCFYDAKVLSNDVDWYLMANEDSYTNNVDLIEFTDVPRETKPFEPYIDIALYGKINGWNVEEKIQNHKENGSKFDGATQQDTNLKGNYDNEVYVKLTKDNNCVEIHSNSGNKNSSGMLLINGQEEKCKAKIHDGKAYLENTNVDKIEQLSKSNQKQILDSKFVSSNRNVNNNLFSSTLNVPTWLIFTIPGVLVIGIIALFVYINKNKQQK